ncbi:gas vesicle protein GvpK [Streptomyces sp. NBC_00120]|nr:gas vesicle protein GvpK [Streptomyces sp. NBC_00120]
MEDLTGAAAGSAVAQRLAVDPDSVESDLIKLILTIVELLRQLVTPPPG